ncbi:MAG: radical SAM protein [Desulfosporosinus sp.]
MLIQRPAAPFYVQFELTFACNHHCFFCYNEMGKKTAGELSFNDIKNILDQLQIAGVYSINFNGGEPLLRKDFYEIARYAHGLGFDLHLNSNGTLIGEREAIEIAKYFPSVCVSVLSSDPEKHDRLTGCSGAFADVSRGIEQLLKQNVKVEINVCTFKNNYRELYDIARLFAREGVHVFCVTRYILSNPAEKGSLLGKEETIEVLELLEKISDDFPTYKEVKLPGPVPYCELSPEYTKKLKTWNTPCQVGYGLCRISPIGVVTPCPLSEDVIGDLRNSSFIEIWNSPGWIRYAQCEHLTQSCIQCKELPSCRGGCVGYDGALEKAGLTPDTEKWRLG